VPYARVDFGLNPERAEGSVMSTRAVLTDLVFELNRPCPGYGQLGFPRFVVGELAIHQPLDVTDRGRARAQMEQALEEHRSIDKLGSFLEALAKRRRIDPAVTRVGLRLALKAMTSWGGGRRAVLGRGVDWYGQQNHGFSNDPLEALVDLNRRSRRTNDELDQRAFLLISGTSSITPGNRYIGR
jgi:hypothetical protein